MLEPQAGSSAAHRRRKNAFWAPCRRADPFFLYLPFAIPHLSIQADPELTEEYTDRIPEEEYEHRGYLEHPTPRAGYAAMVTQMATIHSFARYDGSSFSQ